MTRDAVWTCGWCNISFLILFPVISESCLCALVSLPDVTPGTVKLITEFAYTGVLPVTTDNVQELFIAADRFGISGIMQACSNFMEKQISPQNCISIWGFTNFYYNPQLMKALLFMLNHFEAVVTTSDEFLMLSANELIKIIESDRLIVKQERMVFEAILCWINFAPDHRKEYISLLLSKVSKGQLLKCLWGFSSKIIRRIELNSKFTVAYTWIL